MIYIFCALYHEAEPLIREYGLKKKTDETCFPVFFSEEENILLTVTGCGMNAATAAVARICTKRLHSRRIFWSISVLAQKFLTQKDPVKLVEMYGKRNRSRRWSTFFRQEKNSTGTVSKGRRSVSVQKMIMEHVTGRTFYPDILYRHPFEEAEIVTGAMLYHTENKTELIPKYETAIKNSVADGFLYDMEASSIYQAGAYFFGPHQMSFLKVVTDEGNVQELSAEMLKQSIAGAVPGIRSYLDELRKIDGIKKLQNKKAMGEVSELAQKLNEDMHCSAVMQAAVMQHLKYAVLAGIDYQES